MKKPNECEFEPRVIKSLKSGLQDETVSAHLDSCADCRETAKIISFFQTNISCESAPKNLPTAGLVWWKARLREKQRRAERAAQPILIAQIIAAAAFFAVVGLFICQPDFFAPVADVLSRTFDALEQTAFVFFAVAVVFTAAALIIVFTMRRETSKK